jgi:predicted alpha-1,2-mannosidase
MRKILLHILVIICLSSSYAQKSNIDYVNPFIGTGGHGHTYPGVTAPFGMVQLSPDTRLDGWDGCSGYHYSDSIVYGFSHTHLSGTGVSDYGDILLMPTTGEIRLNNGADGKPGYRSKIMQMPNVDGTFQKQEAAYPMAYTIGLEDYQIAVSLYATTHCGLHYYRFPRGEKANIILDLKHRDEVLEADFQQIDSLTVQGYRISKAWAKEQRIYFYLQFFSPVSLEKTISSNGKNLVGGFTLNKNAKNDFLVKIGISNVSIEGAKKNLNTEISDWDILKVVNESNKSWQNLLNKIQIESPNEDDKTNFYTALYHLYQVPNTIQDVDSQYLGMDLKAHKAEDYTHYTVFSLWDTYRAAHPLYTILQPKRVNDFVKTFLDDYKHSGALPMWPLAANETWCMIGNHAIPVMVDYFLKNNQVSNAGRNQNLANIDINYALEAMIKTTEINHFGQKEYAENGFIPAEMEHESVSKTLEYAYDDYCIALMAKALGNEKIYQKFIRRAQNYKHVFNPDNGFSQAKINNTWVTPFAPAEVNSHFTEGNSWHYSFSAPQDMNGFIKLHGGKAAVEAKLDALFSASSQTSGRDQSDLTGFIGQYVQGNEPSHHIAYLYNFVGKPHKTQALIHQIMSDFYKNQPDGLIGNEDCGQMSAWYIFSAMGFYPVNPCGGQYIIGTPRFPSLKIDLENNKSFTIKALNLSDKNFYIQSATLNGKPLTHSWLMHEDIMNGGELIFTMGDKPSTWANSDADSPVTAITDNEVSPLPFVKKGERSFMKNTSVELGCADRNTKIFYTLDGSEPNDKSLIYTQPILLDQTTTVKFVAEKTILEGQVKVQKSTFSKIPVERKITLKNKYAPQYSAGGDNALIDFIKGNKNYHTGAWQGYEGIDCEAMIDLGSEQPFSKISIGVLQDQNAWIFAPKEIEIFISTDNLTFLPFSNISNSINEHEEDTVVKDFFTEKKGKARFVKIVVKNRGLCPAWHKAAAFNGKSWIFLDEIRIE